MDGFVAPRVRLRPRLGGRSLRGAADERLVAQIRGRDGPAARASFEVLFDRHHRGILAFCRHMLGSAEDAEDAVQHTFSSAYRALLRDDRDIALRAWLYAIARNRCLSMLAARREQVALDDVEAMLPSAQGLVAEVERRSDLRDLLADLQRLPEDQRAALVLAELEAHSHKEIAAILEVPPSKVKALVFQARETLMTHRLAREADCSTIREQLSVLRGGALRKRELRRHVEYCEGCRLFEAEVRRQRAGMALLLPVAPTFALKNSTLASAFAAGTTGAGTAAGVAAIAGGGGVAGGIAFGTQAIGSKVLATLAIAGGAGGGGYVAVQEVRDAPAPRTAAPAAAKGTAAPAARPTPVVAAPAVVASPVLSPLTGAVADEDRADSERSGERGSRGPATDRAGKRGRGPDGARDGRGRGRADRSAGSRGAGRSGPANRQDAPRRDGSTARQGRSAAPQRDREARQAQRDRQARQAQRDAERRERAASRARSRREAQARERERRRQGGRRDGAAPLDSPVRVPPAGSAPRERTGSGSSG